MSQFRLAALKREEEAVREEVDRLQGDKQRHVRALKRLRDEVRRPRAGGWRVALNVVVEETVREEGRKGEPRKEWGIGSRGILRSSEVGEGGRGEERQAKQRDKKRSVRARSLMGAKWGRDVSEVERGSEAWY